MENCEKCLRDDRVQEYEDLVSKAMVLAKEMQDFLWDRSWSLHRPYDQSVWIPLFQKRVDKLAALDPQNPHFKVEMRKRLLQQASLSLQAILAMHNMNTPSEQGK